MNKTYLKNYAEQFEERIDLVENTIKMSLFGVVVLLLMAAFFSLFFRAYVFCCLCIFPLLFFILSIGEKNKYKKNLLKYTVISTSFSIMCGSGVIYFLNDVIKSWRIKIIVQIVIVVTAILLTLIIDIFTMVRVQKGNWSLKTKGNSKNVTSGFILSLFIVALFRLIILINSNESLNSFFVFVLLIGFYGMFLFSVIFLLQRYFILNYVKEEETQETVRKDR